MTLVAKPFSTLINFSRGTGATRVNSAGLIVGVDFSVTSNTIATGSKTFTLAADLNVNRDWPVGSNVIAVAQAGATGTMTGTVTSYTPSTQSLVINVVSVTGSGTSTDWRIGSLEMREDYDPVTLVRRGVLSEVASTNLLNVDSNSVNLSFVSATRITNAGIAPNGSNNAIKYVAANGVGPGSNRAQFTFTAIPNKYYIISVFAKKAEFTSFAVGAGGSMGSQLSPKEASFNLVTGTTDAPSVSTIQDYGNGWYRCSLVVLAPSTTGAVQVFTQTGDGTSGVLLFGFQLEVSDTSILPAPSYIPTTSTQVTRNADSFPLTSAALTSIRQGESTLYAEIDCPDTGVAQKRALRLSGVNADIRIGKQGTGTLSNFPKMAEGAGLRLMGTANSLIRGNGQEMIGVTAVNDRTGTLTALQFTNAVAFDGVNRFLLATNTATNNAANEEVQIDPALTTFSGRGLGALELNTAYHNGSRFLIGVNNPGVVVISDDGQSYRRINSLAFSGGGTIGITSGLVGGISRNVAVGSNGFIATSDNNGETWTSRTSGVATDLVATAFGASTFVVLSSTAANSRYSTDGITYLSVTGLTGNPSSIFFTGSQFVAINTIGGVFTSNNGQAFTAVTTTGISPAFTSARGVTYENGFYVIVGNGGQIAISQTGAAASPATWTTFVTAQTGTSNNLQKVSAFGANFYAVGDAQTIIRFGQSLTPTFSTQPAGVGSSLRGVVASATTIITVGTTGAITSSTDGTTFTSRTNNNQVLNGIAFGNNTFVSVGNAANGSGYIATIAADGTVTRRVSGVNSALSTPKFLNGAFYVGSFVNMGGRILRSSDGGQTWQTLVLGGIAEGTFDIAFGNNIYIAAQGTGRVVTSTDGTTFSQVSTGVTSQTLRAIDFANGTFVLVGDAGAIITTTSGTTYTLRNSNTTANLNSVMFSTRDNLWYAAGNGGVLLYSPDAITWTAVQNSGTASILGTTLQSNQPLPQFKSGVNKIALSYKQNQVIAALNGVASTSDTTATIPVITAASIAENLNGYINKVEIFPTALTTAELTAKTL